MKLSALSRGLVMFALLTTAPVPAGAWTRKTEAGGGGVTVTDSNGAVVGKLLNDTMVVLKIDSGYVKLTFDEYGFVGGGNLVFVYPTTDCSGTPYLQQIGVPPTGVAVPDTFEMPPYRAAAEVYYPGPVMLRTIASYARPLDAPPGGCVRLQKPSKVLAGTVEKRDLHFTAPFTLK